MTYKPETLIEELKHHLPCADIDRAVAHLERMKETGCTGLSLGTFAPGKHPRSWAEWSRHFADLQDWLNARTPEQVSADLRAGEDFIKLDSALCERNNALNFLAAINAPEVHARVREVFDGDALKYFENSLKIARAMDKSVRLTSCDAAPEVAVMDSRSKVEALAQGVVASPPAPIEAAWPQEWKHAIVAANDRKPMSEKPYRAAHEILDALARVGALKKPMDEAAWAEETLRSMAMDLAFGDFVHYCSRRCTNLSKETPCHCLRSSADDIYSALARVGAIKRPMGDG